MTHPAGSSYYVRTRGRVQGPLSAEKLKLLRSRGQFGRASEVSLDGLLWSPTSAFPELFEREPAATSQAGAPGPEAEVQPFAVQTSTAGVTVAREPGVPWKPLLLAGAMLTVSITLVATAWLATRDGTLKTAKADTSAPEEFASDAETSVEDISVPVAESDSTVESDATNANSDSVTSGVETALGESAAGVNAGDSETAAEQRAAESATVEPTEEPAPSGSTPDTPTSDSRPAEVIESAVDPADEDAREAAIGLVVCGYTCELEGGKVKDVPMSTGSSFVISGSGHALTNRHVVDETYKLLRSNSARRELEKSIEKEREWKIESLVPAVWVFFDGERQAASIEYVSTKCDMAILKLEKTPAACFALSNDSDLAKGTPVYALGYPGAANVPLTEEGRLYSVVRAHVSYADAERDTNVETVLPSDSFDFTITSGILSRRRIDDDGNAWIQHDAAFSSGNSGGPLILTNGRVVGINTLLAQEVQGIFVSLSMPQLRDEIDAQVPGVVWK